VVEQWSENSYYPYFSGEKVFACGDSCEASQLVHFRHRIGEEGIELIFKESIHPNGKMARSRRLPLMPQVRKTAQEAYIFNNAANSTF
jgi:IS5 family transposase